MRIVFLNKEAVRFSRLQFILVVTGGYGIFTLLSSCNQLFINHF